MFTTESSRNSRNCCKHIFHIRKSNSKTEPATKWWAPVHQVWEGVPLEEVIESSFACWMWQGATVPVSYLSLQSETKREFEKSYESLAFYIFKSLVVCWQYITKTIVFTPSIPYVINHLHTELLSLCWFWIVIIRVKQTLPTVLGWFKLSICTFVRLEIISGYRNVQVKVFK